MLGFLVCLGSKEGTSGKVEAPYTEVLCKLRSGPRTKGGDITQRQVLAEGRKHALIILRRSGALCLWRGGYIGWGLPTGMLLGDSPIRWGWSPIPERFSDPKNSGLPRNSYC